MYMAAKYDYKKTNLIKNASKLATALNSIATARSKTERILKPFFNLNITFYDVNWIYITVNKLIQIHIYVYAAI